MSIEQLESRIVEVPAPAAPENYLNITAASSRGY